MPQSAAVVDLNEFRRRREARPEPKKTATTPMRPPFAALPVPVLVCWVPVWVVA